MRRAHRVLRTGTESTDCMDRTGTHDRPPARRRSRDALLLVVNLCILVFGVTVVALKIMDRAGTGHETPLLDTATLPLVPRDDTRSVPADPDRGVRARAPASPTDDAPAPGVAASFPPSPSASRAEGEIPPEQGGAPREEGDPPPAPLRVRGQVDAVLREETPGVPVPRAADALRALAATEEAIDRIGVDLEVLHAIRGAYPTSAAPYGTHRGIEALHVALAKVGKTAGLRLGDTDEDGRLEILDAWGRPLVYFSPDDYGSVQRWAPGDGEAIDVAARRSRTSGVVRASGSYQLWSAGPDGRPSTDGGDDVTSWVSRD